LSIIPGLLLTHVCCKCPVVAAEGQESATAGSEVVVDEWTIRKDSTARPPYRRTRSFSGLTDSRRGLTRKGSATLPPPLWLPGLRLIIRKVATSGRAGKLRLWTKEFVESCGVEGHSQWAASLSALFEWRIGQPTQRTAVW